MPKILNPDVSEMSTCKDTLSSPNVKNIDNAFTKIHTHSTPNLWTFSHTMLYEKVQLFELKIIKIAIVWKKSKLFLLFFCDFEHIKTGFRRFKILVLTVDIKSPIYEAFHVNCSSAARERQIVLYLAHVYDTKTYLKKFYDKYFRRIFS